MVVTKEYMREYWKNNPDKYFLHLTKIKLKRNTNRFLKVIDSMLDRIDLYFYRQDKIGVESENAARRMGETNVRKSKKV